MSLLFSVKLLGDVCLYFALAAHFAPQLSLLGAALLWAVCGGACAALEHRGALRLLPLLPSLLAFLLVSSWQQGLVLVLPVVYLWALVLTGRFQPDYSRCCDFFPKGAAAVGVLLALSFYGLSWRLTLLYGGSYLLVSIFLLRQLRLGAGKGWQDKAWNLASLGLWLAAGVGACLLVWLILLLRYPLGAVLGVVIDVVFAGLLWLAERIPLHLTRPDGRPETELPTLNTEHLLPQFAETGTEGSPVLATVLTALGIALLLAAAYFLLRRLVGGMNRRAAHSPRWSEAAPIAVKAKVPSLGRSPRDRMRRLYRKFLLLSKSRGAELAPAQTTREQVAYAGGAVDKDAAGKLRELYLPARYGGDPQVSPQALREAKELLRSMEKSHQD